MDEGSLERILGFSADDLAANREGRLSSGQATRLLSSGIWRLVVGPPVLVASIAIAFVVGDALYALIALVVAGLGLYFTWRGFAHLADAIDAAVAFVTGPLGRHVVHTRYGVSYSAVIGPVSKSISFDAYNDLPEGLRCHLYYSPGCRSLLSLEPASAAEPKPAHPFGPDSAHVWDRLRWSWVLMTIGSIGLLIGAHQVAIAHPAHPVAVGGTIASYAERHSRRSTLRYLYLSGDTTGYSVQREGTYTPEPPPWGAMIGRDVVLHVNSGTKDVIGVGDGRYLYAGDWYLHPEHETVFEAVNGAITGGVALITLLLGVAGVALGRRVAPTLAAGASAGVDIPDSYTIPGLYMPPTVRPALSNWPALSLAGVVLATAAVVFALTIHR